MDFLKIINRIARFHSKILMLTLSILIFVLFTMSSYLGTEFSLKTGVGQSLLILWILFSLLSFIYMVNGLLLDRTFRKKIEQKRKLGKPLEGVRGYAEFREAMVKARVYSILITIGSISSLIIFIVSMVSNFEGIANNEQNFRALLVTFAMTFAFITISLLFLIEYPEETSFSPGGLIGFYEPDQFKMRIDNFLFDIFKAFLDPITLIDIEEWSQFIFEHLDPKFEADEGPKVRLEQARERILLLLYLHYANTALMTDKVLTEELGEIVGSQNVNKIIDGLETGLTLWEIQSILQRIESISPEPFRLVDRLLVALTDDYELFINEDLYFTVFADTNPGSVRETTGILAFFLNNSEDKERSVMVELNGGRDQINPDYQKFKLKLDTLTDPYPDDQPKLRATSGEDLISILSDLLSVGDAVWFRINPKGFGYKIITVQAESSDGKIFGESFELRFTKSVRYYARTYLPRLSGAASIALPLLQGYIGLQL